MSEIETISSDWYDRNAQRYMASTLDADLSHIYASFLRYVPEGGRILDAGCGPGRDSLVFQQMGYDVTALDASAEMVRIASERLGKPVLQIRHQDVVFRQTFDGIWSMASLLHVPQAELRVVFEKYRNALVPGGVLFASFKHGQGESRTKGRLFSNQNRQSLERLIAPIADLEVIDTWVDFDNRPGRSHEEWVSVLCRRATTVTP
jgi:2-polyprenyl-3-methyl-5-hydroxy-6-metoxy-1,4-benzoquinol methylase